MIINSNQINTIWRNRPTPRNNIIVDGTYETLDKAVILDKIFPLYWRWLSMIKLTKWAHKWDCDNFAESFKVFSDGFFAANVESEAEAYGIGMIHYVANSKSENGKKGGHAINIALTIENNQIIPLFIYPQNGMILTLTPEEYNSIWMIYM